MKTYVLLSLLAVLLCGGCTKIDLAPANYNNCKINGTSWAAGCSTAFSDCKTARISNHNTTFILSGSNDGSQAVSIALIDSLGLHSGEYQLTYSPNGFGGNVKDYNKSFQYNFITDSNNRGKINLVFDNANKRVSGTYYFRAKFEQSADVVNITQGRFSLPCTSN